MPVLARRRLKRKPGLRYTACMMDVTLRRFAPTDMQWLVARHQDLYSREAGFDSSFGVQVADILHSFCAAHDPACERGWMAVSGTERLGTVFCMKKDRDTAQLRLFLLTPKARGKGLGKRLLRECMAFARAAGYSGHDAEDPRKPPHGLRPLPRFRMAIAGTVARCAITARISWNRLGIFRFRKL